MADPPTPNNPAELARLRELALRLLARHHDPTIVERAELLVGRLPADLPVDIPLPPGARLLGSYTSQAAWGQGMRMRTNMVVLTGTPPEAELHAFYERELPQAGWALQDLEGAVGGFASEHHAMLAARAARPRMLHLEHPDGNLLMMIWSGQGAGAGSATLTIHVTPGARPRTRSSFLLPALRAPEASSSEQQSGGGPGDHQHSSAGIMVFGMDLAALAEHYRRQLEGHGWVLVGEHGHALGITYEWQIAPGGERWHGRLTIVEDPDDWDQADTTFDPAAIREQLEALPPEVRDQLQQQLRPWMLSGGQPQTPGRYYLELEAQRAGEAQDE